MKMTKIAKWTSEQNIAHVMKSGACDRATAISYLEAEEGDIAGALRSLRGDRGMLTATDYVILGS